MRRLITQRKKLIKACDIPRLAEALGVKINEIYNAGMENQTIRLEYIEEGGEP